MAVMSREHWLPGPDLHDRRLMKVSAESKHRCEIKMFALAESSQTIVGLGSRCVGKIAIGGKG